MAISKNIIIQIMSTFNPQTEAPRITDARVAVIRAEWNNHITSKLANDAIATLQQSGLNKNDIEIYTVPGTVELTYAAARVMAKTAELDAVIVFGVVIRGDTPHFDYVCESVTQGVTKLNAEGHVPVIFGVLTVDNEQQALDRIGGPAGNKGIEAAQTALKMIEFSRSLD